MSSWSYWPSTRVDIQPSTRPIWAPVIWRDSEAGIGAPGPVAVDLGRQLVGDGPQQTLKGRHVGVDPLGPVGHPGPGRAGQRPQPGLGRHQLLGFGGQLLEVGLQQALAGTGSSPPDDGRPGSPRRSPSPRRSAQPCAVPGHAACVSVTLLCPAAARSRPAGRGPAQPADGSGDLPAAGPGHRHRLVLVAVLPVVVHRQLGPATRLPAGPVLAERLRRPLAAAQGVSSEGSLAHFTSPNAQQCRRIPASYTSFPGVSDASCRPDE